LVIRGKIFSLLWLGELFLDLDFLIC
jgi:hypothetical protein